MKKLIGALVLVSSLFLLGACGNSPEKFNEQHKEVMGEINYSLSILETVDGNFDYDAYGSNVNDIKNSLDKSRNIIENMKPANKEQEKQLGNLIKAQESAEQSHKAFTDLSEEGTIANVIDTLYYVDEADAYLYQQ